MQAQNISVIALADCIDLVEYVLDNKLTSELQKSTSLQVVVTIIRQSKEIDVVKITANGEVLYKGKPVPSLFFDGLGNVQCPNCENYFLFGLKSD